MYPLSKRDYAAAAIGLVIIVGAHLWLHFIAKPPAAPINGRMGAHEAPAEMYPACDWFPDGVDGKPCMDDAEFERTGRRVFYKHWPGPSYSFPAAAKD